MDEARALVRRWVEEGLLPGAVLVVRGPRGERDAEAFGSARMDTVFDLASLTKVIVTLPVMLSLIAGGKLSLDDPAAEFIPEFRHRQVTIRHLLSHSSGLPADLPWQPRHAADRDVRGEILAQPLDFEPGSRAVYSDLGMILLGWIAETVAGDRLDRLARKFVFEPLGMTDTMFRPPASLAERIAPTEEVDGVAIRGEVHDEKCFHLGGICGSAGLFSTAADVAKYAQWWLDRQPVQGMDIPPDLMDACIRPIVGNRGLGWEVWSGSGAPPACGERWSIGSFGHTGFTGTSVWIDPAARGYAVFLTNAVHFGRGNRIRELRPELHSVIYSSFHGD
jgi:CubicO group peptidase (beta-lactamase class C family)